MVGTNRQRLLYYQVSMYETNKNYLYCIRKYLKTTQIENINNIRIVYDSCWLSVILISVEPKHKQSNYFGF